MKCKEYTNQYKKRQIKLKFNQKYYENAFPLITKFLKTKVFKNI